MRWINYHPFFIFVFAALIFGLATATECAAWGVSGALATSTVTAM